MNIATIIYIPDLIRSADFLFHFQSFKRAFPCVIITDGPVMNFPLRNTFMLQVPGLGVLIHTRRSNMYALWAFYYAANFALCQKFDHFLYVEEDCRFTCDNWDQAMAAEFERWPNGEPLFGGTPVAWHPWCLGYKHSMKMVEYAYRYQCDSGVNMGLEGGHDGQFGFSMYPNGALAIYNTREVIKYFPNAAKWHSFTHPEKLNEASKLFPFDVALGKRFFAAHGADVLNKLAFLPSSYSGCGNHHAQLSDRIEMYRNKTKVAIHHLKELEFPYEKFTSK